MYIFARGWIKQLLILPTLLFFLVYTLYPIIDSLSKAFFSRSGFLGYTFIGLKNFNTLFHEEVFPIALRNTFTITILQLIILIPLGIILALLLNATFKLSTALKLITFAPYIVNGILTTLIWYFIVDPGVGLINTLEKKLGMDWAVIRLIGGPHLTPYTVAILDSWKGIGFFAVLFYAAMKMMPKEMFEAAEIDGANRRQRLFFITVPMLKETIKLASVMIVFGGIGTYQTVMFLTNYGPHSQSQTFSGLLLKWGALSNVGEARALGLFMFAISMILTIGILVFSNKKVDE